MNKKIVMLLTFFLVFILIAPLNEINASNKKVVVTTKTLNYKGQQYIQLVGGNKTATDKINKVLKQHAVQTATWSTENKKKNGGYNLTRTSVKYNKNEIISIVYTDIGNVGGYFDMTSYTAYNFDLKTGNQIKLEDIVKSKDQTDNLVQAIKETLLEKVRKGISIEDSFLNNITLKNSYFYYYTDGVVIGFDRYIVSMTDSIEIKVPFSAINKRRSQSIAASPLVFTLNEKSKSELEKGAIPGFYGITMGMSKKQVTDIVGKKTSDSYIIDGGQFWRFEGTTRVGFNFNDLIYQDKLSYVQIGKESLKEQTMTDVIKYLGNANQVYDTEGYSLEYKFGKTNILFYSNTKDGLIISVDIYQK